MARIHILFSGLLFAFSSNLFAGEIRIAVASNFAQTMKQISHSFEKRTGHQVRLSFGSTGKHYAQIINGAPFDAFFAADELRPRLLIQQQKALTGSRFTYAQGQLVLWSNSKDLSRFTNLQQALNTIRFTRLAIANPKLAPYGRASQEVLTKLQLWTPLQSRLVLGENISQAFQFVSSTNAELGLIALSQLHSVKSTSNHIVIPQHLYSPIEQQAVIIKAGSTIEAFLDHIRSDQILKLIRSNGYQTPHVN